MRLLELLSEIGTNIPHVLTMEDAIYIRGRNIRPESIAKIAPADDRAAMNGKGWRQLAYLEAIQQHFLAGSTAAQEIADLAEYGLSEDQDALETLRQVITPSGVEQRYGVPADTVRDACQKGQILAVKSGDTWIMLDYDAQERWGEKPKDNHAFNQARSGVGQSDP